MEPIEWTSVLRNTHKMGNHSVPKMDESLKLTSYPPKDTISIVKGPQDDDSIIKGLFK